MIDRACQKYGFTRTGDTKIRIQLKGRVNGASKKSVMTYGDMVPKVRSNDNAKGIIHEKGELHTRVGTVSIQVWIKP